MYSTHAASRVIFLIIALALSALIARPALSADTDAITGGLTAGYLTYRALEHLDNDRYEYNRPRYTNPRYIEPGHNGYLPPGIYWYPNAKRYRFDKPLKQYGYSYGPRYTEPYYYAPEYGHRDRPRHSRRHRWHLAPRGYSYGLPQYGYGW